MEIRNRTDEMIEKFLSLNGYDTETRKARRKGKSSTQEFFTPYSIVKRMCDKIPEEDWSDPNKTFLEPSCGNGQFLCYIIWNRIQHGIDWKTALETCYGLDLMEDNIQECKERICKLFHEMGISFTKEQCIEINEILNKNMVAHDFFTWNFEEWRPYTEEELHPKKRKKNI